jgi:2-(1,2-epoxy-1,2-dihydrophenyl)acetyl-CoA isomerase
MSEAELLTEVDGAVARITFNRPQVRNALTVGMLQQMHDFLIEVERDRSIRCVVMSGAGQHFMAGGDIARFAASLEVPDDERRRDFEARAQRTVPIFALLQRMPQPIVARVRGAVAGAAIGWVAASDFVVASDTSLFLVAQTALGTSPDAAITWYLPRVVGIRKATEMALLGDRLSAQQALACGLINRVIVDSQLDAEVDVLTARLANGASYAMGRTKLLLKESFVNSLAEQLELECKAFGDCAATEDFVEGVHAFMEKRPARFRGR